MADIKAPMAGRELDRILTAINDAQSADNNGKVLYIRRGKIAFETWAKISDVVALQ